VATLVACGAILSAAGTAPADLARYAAYAALAVTLPGTLVYRLLRRTPHTLVEDLALGAAVGLTLELAAWALYSALDLRGWLWTWPAAVVIGCLAVPAARRRALGTKGFQPVPVGWSWVVGGAVVAFTAYLSQVFFFRNPVLPTDESTRQYVDLPYQLSLAAQAKWHFPLDVPQVAGEPLYYHWFGYAHMASTSLVGGIDLPVVALRLAVPGLCALAALLTAVVGWRVSGRPYAGAVAAVLFWVIGEVNFTSPVTVPFGTIATFVVWHGMSMTYSWVLLIAVIAPLADIVRREGRDDGAGVPALGGGAYVLAALLLLASSGAKASSLPVALAALAFTAVVLNVARRRVPWRILAAVGIAAGAQAFATAALFHFQTYGLAIGPFASLRPFWAPSGRGVLGQTLVVLGVLAALLVNMQLRLAGVLPLLGRQRFRLTPVQVLLLGGGLAGLGCYLVFQQPGGANEYFTRAGFAFGVLLSGWGYVEVVERAALSRRGRFALAGGAAAFVVATVLVQYAFAGAARASSAAQPFAPLLPILRWAGVLAGIAVVGGVLWRVVARRVPGMRRRGGVVLLTLVLVAGAPGLAMDAAKSLMRPNSGVEASVPMARSQVDAARWVREHSAPTDVVATNQHCWPSADGRCDSRVFWLSAYSERQVLIEGWGFAPRIAGVFTTPFWDPDLLALNDAAFQAPDAATLRALYQQHGVRWLVANRSVATESPTLATLAAKAYDSGTFAVYQLHA
jgi:hypothetical protein